MNNIEEVVTAALRDLRAVADTKALENWRVRYLGRKGTLTEMLRGVGSLPLAKRKSAGARANNAKAALEIEYSKALSSLASSREESKSRVAALDVTLPGYPFPVGHKNVLTQAMEEVGHIFHSMGFEVALGPDVEWDYYNFEALNVPNEHPARDTHSTFWVDSKADVGRGPMLLRTQCTAVSARVIEKTKPPIRVIEPGRVYRYEAVDATHLNVYHNVDGLAVDMGVSMADLKGTLYEFARRYFGRERRVRFRPDYFPFVEPGAELSIECAGCGGAGCLICGESGWLEVLGAGMTHPDVLKRGGIDPEIYSSFAFGMGLERLAMLRYGIDDMRLFYTGDLRFIRQF